MTQLLLLRDAYSDHPHFFLSSAGTVDERSTAGHAVYVVGEATRQSPFRLIPVFLRTVRALLRERPDVVVSTGAAPGCFACLVGKLLGAKVVWIDSIANTERLSMSGRIVRPFADLFLTQWPHVAEATRGAEYAGAIL